MQTDYLREFIDLSQTLNFTKSARRLNLSQPTLSRHIGVLEKEIGSSLFDRSFGAVCLTHAGRLFYDETRGILKGLDAAMTDAGCVSREQTFTLKVGSNAFQPTANRFIARMAMRAMKEDLPIRFLHSDIYPYSSDPLPSASTELLRSGKVDLIVDCLPTSSGGPDGCDSFKICSEPLSFLASEDNPLSHANELKLADLSDETLVLVSERSQSIAPCERLVRDGGCSPKGIRVLLVHDFLEIPGCLDQLKPDEVLPIQTNFAVLHGLLEDDMERFRMLDLWDSDAALPFRLAWRASDNRPAIRTAIRLAHDAKESYRSNPSPGPCRLLAPSWEV